MSFAVELAERRLLPDRWVRAGIRNLLRHRLSEEAVRYDQPATRAQWLEEMARSPLALETGAANRQHYEVPAAFFRAVLGPQLKYSSCLWPPEAAGLADAEERMLSLSAERARLVDGQRVLELGCGWGSWTLWMARNYPNSRITAVSNSHSQREWIEGRARDEGLRNVRVITVDINAFGTDECFDRVVSVEMFEHLRNWETLLARICGWLSPEGQLFLHFFAHRRYAYPFEAVAEDDWMGKHFFTGGMMPSADLLSRLQIPFDVAEHWIVGGEHYARTAEAWLANLDENRQAVTELFARDLGGAGARRQVQRWRMFFLACAELFGYRAGDEWVVAHARLARKGGER